MGSVEQPVLLLPKSALPGPSTSLEWQPTRYLSDPQPPPVDDAKVQEQELANARQLLDGKQVKKTRPRRTVDYNSGMGRWILVSFIS
jgi:polyadenylation factor subunit 2